MTLSTSEFTWSRSPPRPSWGRGHRRRLRRRQNSIKLVTFEDSNSICECSDVVKMLNIYVNFLANSCSTTKIYWAFQVYIFYIFWICFFVAKQSKALHCLSKSSCVGPTTFCSLLALSSSSVSSVIQGGTAPEWTLPVMVLSLSPWKHHTLARSHWKN